MTVEGPYGLHAKKRTRRTITWCLVHDSHVSGDDGGLATSGGQVVLAVPVAGSGPRRRNERPGEPADQGPARSGRSSERSSGSRASTRPRSSGSSNGNGPLDLKERHLKAQQREREEILAHTDDSLWPDDTGYKPSTPDPLLNGAARATGITAKVVRRRHTVTEYQHDRMREGR